MQIEYQFGLDDIVAFNLHHFRTSPASKRRIRRRRRWGVALAFVTLFLWTLPNVRVLALLYSVYAFYLLLGVPLYYQWFAGKRIKSVYAEGRNKGSLGNHIIAIDAVCVTEISDVGESRTTWDGIERVEENDAYIFIYTGSLQAHVIPKCAFLSESEAAMFFRLALTYHAGSLSLTSGSGKTSTGIDSAEDQSHSMLTTAKVPRILSIYIDPDTCTCSQACVVECPEVLDGDTEDGVPRIRDDAEQYFESHVEQIKRAAYVCPVEAVRVEVEGE